MSHPTPPINWQPSDEFKSESNLLKYQQWLKENYQLEFENYDELWKWSVDHYETFWSSLLSYFDIAYSGKYEQVCTGDQMPGVQWFEGIKVNYAEHIFQKANHSYPAIIFKKEGQEPEETSWKSLETQVTSFAGFLKSQGVAKGDRVVAYIPSIPEATIAFLACCSIGAVWSSCSPDFGAESVVDRFKQIDPKVLIAVDGYHYNGKPYDRREIVREVISQLEGLTCVVELPYFQEKSFVIDSISWREALNFEHESLSFERVGFNDPIWILYSSGTTGHPKAITHSQGGVLLEHLKYVTFHNNVKAGERYFWFTTTGWMMWNFVQATMLAGATIVLFDGSPSYPAMSSLWQFASEQKINHFGTSAPYILASEKAEIRPNEFDLSSLISISSTGSPLPAEGFSWVYQHVKKDLWFCSMSGGTDVCSAFVGGCPTEPVYEGEIQRRALGCALYAYDEEGKQLVDEVGEMVITKPMPSMPIYFWNDQDNSRYRESYFEEYPNVWRHGDWVKITNRNSVIILGRSDATLNRHGIRIGSAEIYQATNKIQGVQDSLVVNCELSKGRHFMPLFVKVEEGIDVDENLVKSINAQIKSDFSQRHVPDVVVQVEELPYTISGKKMEAAVKKILMGINAEKAANFGAMRNPDSLSFFIKYRDEFIT
ncbi:MAG: acetoacetate--CoA ligase [Cyclobacteriaceae bacterium]